ncbi:AFG1/ZapE family ATPase [Microbacterium elymi]|uniref:AFG1/ZapE family ATPase n=1 Tax=Microbacterium elymi TaxID=2909587 RepID=A0ABY3SSQ2_9MICO|nr:AFG1/ZapE family ATPase [Microbacterium elymi]UJP12621.2 AFG1/ZapE family ATPase [Microbacterium elymi]
MTTGIVHLTDRLPQVTGPEMVAALVPPPQFREATFDSYRPDPAYPSQLEAKEKLAAFSNPTAAAGKGGLFRRAKKAPPTKPGVYLDGGFGVGKTHLLASRVPRDARGAEILRLVHRVHGPGRGPGVSEDRGPVPGFGSLPCIDEFELDDPGDTMVMTRLLGELVATGTRLAATSNTPPNALGEGRFAAQDFLREIQAMADAFETIRIDGTDYRQRAVDGAAVVLGETDYERTIADAAASGVVSDDAFTGLVAHLARVHPSRYIRLIDGVDEIGLRDVVQAGRPVRGAAAGRLHRPRVRRADPDPRQRACAQRRVQCRDAGRRLSEEVSSGRLAADRADGVLTAET